MTVGAVRFIGLVFAYSWSLWLIGIGTDARIRPFWLVAGAFGPSLVAIGWCVRNGTWGELVRRFTELRRVRFSDWSFRLFVLPAIALLAMAFAAFLGVTPPRIHWELINSPARIAVFLIAMAIGGPLAEEFGWRGVALDELQSRLRPVAASLLLGVVWTIWHVPLFFLPGTSQEAMGFGSPLFWLWSADVTSSSAVYTWLHNRTERSILAAFLLHFQTNAIYTLLAGWGGALSLLYESISILFRIALALAILWVLKTRTGGPEPARASRRLGRTTSRE